MKVRLKEHSEGYATLKQRSVLIDLLKEPLIREAFFLTGGTALSVFYLQHRISEDLDLFSFEPVDLPKIDVFIQSEFGKQRTLLRSSEHFFSYVLKEIKVDFVIDPLSESGTRPICELAENIFLQVDTVSNISSNKLSAAASRGELKDLIDLYFIARDIWAPDIKEKFLTCYKNARLKEVMLDDPATAAYQIELSVKNITLKDIGLLNMLKEIDWPSIEIFYKEMCQWIYAMEDWG